MGFTPLEPTGSISLETQSRPGFTPLQKPALTDYVGAAVRPVIRTAQLLRDEPAKAATDLMVSARQFANDPSWGAAGQTGLNLLNYVSSPFTAAARGLVGEPVEKVTGIPSALTEFVTLAALPFAGKSRAIQQALNPATKAVIGIPDTTPAGITTPKAEPPLPIVKAPARSAQEELPALLRAPTRNWGADLWVSDKGTDRLFAKAVTPEVSEKMSKVAKEYFDAFPDRFNPRMLVSDNMVAEYLNGNLSTGFLDAHGLKPAEFMPQWRQTIRASAQRLGYLSQVARSLKITQNEADQLRSAGLAVDDTTVLKPIWKRIDDIRRALLVSQLSTAARNFEVQLGRLGLDVLQAPIDAGIQKLTGRSQTVSPLDGLAEFSQLFRRNKETTDKILSNFPAERDRLFANYMSDIDISRLGPLDQGLHKALSKAERGVFLLNWANRLQEFVVRRAVFQTALSQRLAKDGKKLSDMVARNAVGEIPLDAVEIAVRKALDTTFASQPASGTIARDFVDIINKIPGATLAIPFPRFMANSLKFLWEYNPTGILSYLSKSEREAFAAGDTSKMSKAIIGSGLLATAFAIRQSPYAGDKWYELRTPAGNIIDMRPFNPFASYLFIADVAKKAMDGNLHSLALKDVVMGLAASNLRAGTGLVLVDQALDSLSDFANERKFQQAAKGFAGQVAAGFLTPLGQLRDLYAEFDVRSREVKDTQLEPFLGPIKNRIPGVSASLPPAAFATRETPRETVHPFTLKQLTGLQVSTPKNAAESELDRLGFTPREVLQKIGVPEIDRAYAHNMGIAVERLVSPAVQSAKYASMTNAEKSAALAQILNDVRGEVRDYTTAQLTPQQQIEVAVASQPSRVRKLMRERGLIE